MIKFTKVALPYGWLGNMSRFAVTYDGVVWPTTEHLFQAMRFAAGNSIREQIRATKSPMAAKMLAKSNVEEMIIAPRSKEDLDLMRQCLRLKVEQHPQLKGWLLETKDEPIVEDATKRPNESGLFWGLCLMADGEWHGLNWLGTLWMELRTEIQQSGS